MTYKRADRPGWSRLRARRFVCQRLSAGHISGYVTLLLMVDVAEPLWVTHHAQRVCIADTGYSWLQVFPEGAPYTHTTMFNAEGEPVQDYIDLVAGQGIDEKGVPWYDDLYLDITWMPDGTPILLDAEELEAAHAIEAISQEQYDMARGEAARLLVALACGDYPLPEIARARYPTLRAALDANACEAATPGVMSEASFDAADHGATEQRVETRIVTTTEDGDEHA